MAATTTKLVTATDTSWTEVTGGLGCIIQALVGAGVVVAVATTQPAADTPGIQLGCGKILDVTRVLQAGRQGLGPGRRYQQSCGCRAAAR